MSRLVIFDGHAILHRAFHALPPLTTKDGKMVNAVYGFLMMMLKVINDLKPEYLIVTFDRPKPTFRKALYVGYQAQREKMDETLVPQIKTIHEVLGVMGVSIFEMDGYEADDVIGTLANKASGQENRKQITDNPSTDLRPGKKHKNGRKDILEVVIVTGDRDILQLVNEHVKVLMPGKSLSDGRIYDECAVEEKYGIRSSQIVDYKALVGDASDNYPGVAGIGPKTAANLLTQFGTLENLYQHLAEVENENIRLKLAENIESAGLAKKLATIHREVPIILKLDKCKMPDFNTFEVVELFHKLEFKSLIPRLSGGIKNDEVGIKQEEKKEEKEEVQQIQLF